jgi:hypothetical protein
MLKMHSSHTLIFIVKLKKVILRISCAPFLHVEDTVIKEFCHQSVKGIAASIKCEVGWVVQFGEEHSLSSLLILWSAA